MSAVDETIVREYFEAHGFLVCQRRKYVVQTRQKSADEEINLIVLNPQCSGNVPATFELDGETLKQVSLAIVAVKGWHTEIFSPGLLAHQPKIFRFVETRSVEEAKKLVGGDGLLKILIVPGLPRDEKTRERSIELLRAIMRLPAYASTPVILISTLNDEAMKQKATSQGAFAYVVKPFNSEKMEAVFSKLK